MEGRFPIHVFFKKTMTDRITTLLSQMTLEEKAHELGNDAPANERLGIRRMNHGEILHG